jgi:hypothetical protein
VKVAMLTLASLISIGAGGIASPVGRSAGPPCVPKVTKIHGETAAENCGPATVSLTVGGGSYHFKSGLCTTSASTKAFELNLGTAVPSDHEHNAGLPNFSMTVSGSTADLTATYGGKDLIGTGMTLVTVTGSGKNIGTFTNKLPTPKVGGSWNCHGVIYKGP